MTNISHSADLQYALHAGTIPRFNPNKLSPLIIRSTFGQLVPREELSNLARNARVNDTVLRDVLIDLMSISYFFNDSHVFVKLDPYAYQEILIVVCYQLLQRNPLLCEGFEDVNENACHLGLLVLVTKLLFQHGRSRKFPYHLLLERVRFSIQSSLSNKLVAETTRLWLLFVAGISVFGDTKLMLLMPQIRILLSGLNIDSWENARKTIKTLPWIDAVHDKPGKELWQTIVCE